MNKNAKSYLLRGVLVTLNTGKEATILTGGIVNNEIRTSAGQVSVDDITGIEHYTVKQVSKMPVLQTGLSFKHMINDNRVLVLEIKNRAVSEHIVIETTGGNRSVITKQHICYIMNGCYSGILNPVISVTTPGI